jgi:hypothetical protein
MYSGLRRLPDGGLAVPDQTPILDRIPDPHTIRGRLSDLAAEADLLRALLRLLERRECGRHLMRRRQARREVAHVS